MNLIEAAKFSQETGKFVTSEIIKGTSNEKIIMFNGYFRLNTEGTSIPPSLDMILADWQEWQEPKRCLYDVSYAKARVMLESGNYVYRRSFCDGYYWRQSLMRGVVEGSNGLIIENSWGQWGYDDNKWIVELVTPSAPDPENDSSEERQKDNFDFGDYDLPDVLQTSPPKPVFDLTYEEAKVVAKRGARVMNSRMQDGRYLIFVRDAWVNMEDTEISAAANGFSAIMWRVVK